MPKYECERCLKEFELKSDYTRHKERKFQCKKITPSYPEHTPGLPQKGKSKGENKNICNYCKKGFTRREHLMRHIDNNCKIKRENDIKMEELMEMMIELKESNKRLEERDKMNTEKIEKLEKKSQTINNTVNINIKINAYGTEDMSKIAIRELKKIFKRGLMSVPALLTEMHFNKNVPENHNVYISNMRDNYVLMFDGEIWRLKDRNEALQQLYEDKAGILETEYEKLIELLDEPTIKMFERFLEVKDEDDDNVKIKVIKKELKKILYENRKMVKKTRRENEE